MKEQTQKTYRCDHCNKLYLRKNAAATHEERCFANPENFRPCFGCANLGRKDFEIESQNCYHIPNRKISLFFCSKKETFLLPPISEHKGNFIDTNDIENNPMPKECKDFKQKNIF